MKRSMIIAALTVSLAVSIAPARSEETALPAFTETVKSDAEFMARLDRFCAAPVKPRGELQSPEEHACVAMQQSKPPCLEYRGFAWVAFDAYVADPEKLAAMKQMWADTEYPDSHTMEFHAALGPLYDAAAREHEHFVTADAFSQEAHRRCMIGKLF